MENSVKKFIKMLHKAVRSRHTFAALVGHAAHEDFLAEVHKNCIKLMHTDEHKARLELLEVIRAKVQTARLTGYIGDQDLKSLIDELDKIEKGVADGARSN